MGSVDTEWFFERCIKKSNKRSYEETKQKTCRKRCEALLQYQFVDELKKLIDETERSILQKLKLNDYTESLRGGDSQVKNSFPTLYKQVIYKKKKMESINHDAYFGSDGKELENINVVQKVLY